MNSDTSLILTDTIRDHYDHISGAYRAWWGEHMHHGYWEDGESLAQAQVKLMERLATQAQIPHFARVLDVGCGLGGASLWLARNLDCSVLGITNSPEQAKIAHKHAHSAGLNHQVRFAVMDANRLDAPRESFDVVWIVECSEHLNDRPGFFRRCERVLKPGGVLALSAWLAAADFSIPERTRLICEVCRGFLCPPLATMQDYVEWIEASGFAPVKVENLTHQVEKTWEHFAALADRWLTKAFLRLSDERTRRCVEAFATVRKAYSEGAMVYGMFTAEKPFRQRWPTETVVARGEAMTVPA